MIHDLLSAVAPQCLVATLVPPIVAPLYEAATKGGDLTAAVQRAVLGLGFDSFLSGVASTCHPDQESRVYSWTSAPREWVAYYDQHTFFEIDPRIARMRTSCSPELWDRSSFPDTAANRRFFDGAARFGIRSGLVVGINRPSHTWAMLTLNSSASAIEGEAGVRFASAIGQALVLATHVHDLFLGEILAKCIPPPTVGKPLSRREREVLQLAAKGLSTSQIASLLDISERTVHYYVGNLLSKLDAVNRREAIAKAMATGLIAA